MAKVRADRLCICWAWGAWCALLYNDEETLCWWQAGTNVTDNCQLANGCCYVCSWNICYLCYTCKACVPSSWTNWVLYITCD